MQILTARAANRGLLELYWYIGHTIVRKQQELGWGKSVVEQLAADLQAVRLSSIFKTPAISLAIVIIISLPMTL